MKPERNILSLPRTKTLAPLSANSQGITQGVGRQFRAGQRLRGGSTNRRRRLFSPTLPYTRRTNLRTTLCTATLRTSMAATATLCTAAAATPYTTLRFTTSHATLHAGRGSTHFARHPEPERACKSAAPKFAAASIHSRNMKASYFCDPIPAPGGTELGIILGSHIIDDATTPQKEAATAEAFAPPHQWNVRFGSKANIARTCSNVRLMTVVSTGRRSTLSHSFYWSLNPKALRKLPAIPKSPFSLPQ